MSKPPTAKTTPTGTAKKPATKLPPGRTAPTAQADAATNRNLISKPKRTAATTTNKPPAFLSELPKSTLETPPAQIEIMVNTGTGAVKVVQPKGKASVPNVGGK